MVFNVLYNNFLYKGILHKIEHTQALLQNGETNSTNSEERMQRHKNFLQRSKIGLAKEFLCI